MGFVIDEEIEVKAPAEVVWEVISDLPRYKEWNPFCLEASSTLKPGDPIRMKVNLTGKPQDVEEVIREVVPGRRFAYSMKPMMNTALTSLRSHDVASRGAAAASYRSHFELNGWMRHVVLALFKAKLENGFSAMTRAVGQRAERLWAERQSGKR